MAENRLLINNLLPSVQYPFYRKIQEESLEEPDQFLADSPRSVINRLLTTKLLEIENFPNQTGISSKDYYNNLSDAKKEYFFTNPQSVLILNQLRNVYHIVKSKNQRPSTPPPSPAELRQRIIFATPPRPSRRSRKTLKRKSRKNRK
jgi:hypothetical protein